MRANAQKFLTLAYLWVLPMVAILGAVLAIKLAWNITLNGERVLESLIFGNLFMFAAAVLLVWAFQFDFFGEPRNKLGSGLRVSFLFFAAFLAVFPLMVAYELSTGNISEARPIWWQVGNAATFGVAALFLAGVAILDSNWRAKSLCMTIWWVFTIGIPWLLAARTLM